MRVFTVPARYRILVEASIALAVADAGRDQKRRAAGLPPTVRPTLTDPDAVGDLVIMVGVPNAEEQEKDLTWPDGPAASTAAKDH